jgi:hypothetical protein
MTPTFPKNIMPRRLKRATVDAVYVHYSSSLSGKCLGIMKTVPFITILLMMMHNNNNNKIIMIIVVLIIADMNLFCFIK